MLIWERKFSKPLFVPKASLTKFPLKNTLDSLKLLSNPSDDKSKDQCIFIDYLREQQTTNATSKLLDPPLPKLTDIEKGSLLPPPFFFLFHKPFFPAPIYCRFKSSPLLIQVNSFLSEVHDAHHGPLVTGASAIFSFSFPSFPKNILKNLFPCQL